MAEQLPGPAQDNNERIIERGYESSFARFPAEEIVAVPVPGAGPRGTIDAGLNVPLAVTAVGFALIFATFVFQVVWLLAAAVALMVVGAVWLLLRNRGSGSGRGTGTVTSSRRRA